MRSRWGSASSLSAGRGGRSMGDRERLGGARRLDGDDVVPALCGGTEQESGRARRILFPWRRSRTRASSGSSSSRQVIAAIRDRLILTYAPLVKFVAGRLGSGLPAHVDEGDLVSYGLLGLIGAIERFDPDREIKFETYAIARIKGAIIDELRALDWVPRSVRARARDIERAIAELEKKLHRAPTDEEIAAKLGMTEDELGASLTEISRSSIAALDELWTVVRRRRPGRADRHDRGHAGPGAAGGARADRDAGGARRGDRPPARAREARRHALLLRGADPARDRRGARRDRVARLAAAHEGDPPPEGAPRRRRRRAPIVRRDICRRCHRADPKGSLSRS